MVARETVVQVLAVVGAIASLVVLAVTDVVTGTTREVLGFLLWHGLVFGGAHLYFVVRGDDGSVPITSRRRFLAVLAVWLALGAVVTAVRDAAVWGVPVWTVAGVTFLVTLVAYLVLEGSAGYRESMREP